VKTNDTMQNLRGYVTTLEDECQRAEVRVDELKQLIDTRNIANNQLLNSLTAVRDWIGWPSAFQLNVEGFDQTLIESGFPTEMLNSLKN